MRTFTLIRDADPTGISGTGVVAEGIEFSDGTTVLRWLRTYSDIDPTTVIHPNLANVQNLHGHNGQTHIEWTDQEDW